MAIPAKNFSYTFADYLTWDSGQRIELIDGEALLMAPPSTAHQLISMELARQLANFLEGKRCKVLPAPFAVRLFEQADERPEEVQTVVEPDLSVVCDSAKLDSRGCKGAPDLVVEVLSPSTQRHDRLVKLNLYQRAGVREYWLVSPEERTVQVLQRSGWLLHRTEQGVRRVTGRRVPRSCGAFFLPGFMLYLLNRTAGERISVLRSRQKRVPLE